MNCRQFQDILQDLLRYEGLDPATLKEALDHAEICLACDDLLAEAEALHWDLRALGESDASRPAPASIEAALLAALAQRDTSVRRSGRRRLAVAALGVAAIALFAITLSRYVRHGAAGVRSRPSAAALAAARGNSAPDSQVAVAVPGDPQGDAVAIFDDEGAAASFVPLTETLDAGSLDGDAVLRVALSRSDLAHFGLSSAQLGQQRDQQVQADLIVSSDGRPQAIRLLPR